MFYEGPSLLALWFVVSLDWQIQGERTNCGV